MGSWGLQQRLGLAQSTSTPHLATSRKVPSGRTISPKRAESELSRNFARIRFPGKQNPGAHPSKTPSLSPFHFDLHLWPCWSFHTWNFFQTILPCSQHPRRIRVPLHFRNEGEWRGFACQQRPALLCLQCSSWPSKRDTSLRFCFTCAGH